jgi:hypothetical protein
MAQPRKIAVFPAARQLGADTTYRVWQVGNPNVFTADAAAMAQATGVPAETAARIAADAAETSARIAADGAEATARANADAAEASARSTGDSNEASLRASADSTLQTNINNEASARASGDTAAHWGALNLSGLPTADPGGGRPWLSSGILKVGP